MLYNYVFDIDKDNKYKNLFSIEDKESIKAEFENFINLLKNNIHYNFSNNSNIIKAIKKIILNELDLTFLKNEYEIKTILNLNEEEFNIF